MSAWGYWPALEPVHIAVAEVQLAAGDVSGFGSFRVVVAVGGIAVELEPWLGFAAAGIAVR